MKFLLKPFGIAFLSMFVLFSCKEKPKGAEGEKEPESSKETASEVIEKDIKEVDSPLIEAKLGVDERAAKLGFASHLPSDTEMLLAVYNTKDTVERFKSLKLYGVMEEMMGMDAGNNIEMEMEEDLEEDLEVEQGEDEVIEEEVVMEEGPSPWILFGQEITIGLGEGTGEQMGNMLSLYNRFNYFQAKVFGKALEAMGKNGDQSAFEDAMIEIADGETFFKELLADSENGMPIIEKAVMPTIYVSFRAKDGEVEQAAQLVGSVMDMFGMAGEMAVPVEFETGGGKFAGYKLLGSKIAEMMNEEKEDMVEDIGAESADALIDAISKKNLVMVTGTVGNYVVLMIGGDEANMKLADSVENSMVAGTKFNFVDAYAEKQLITVAYGDSSTLKSIMDEAGGLGTYATGFRDGMMEGDGLGDIRDITELLEMIVDRETELLSLSTLSNSGTVIYLEEGLKIDAFGGVDDGRIDWDQKTTLAHLGNNPDNLLFMNFSTNEVYAKKMGSYFETIFETAYAVGMKMTEMEIDSEDFQQMKTYAKMFDEKFREDALGIYNALTGEMSDGLGKECAIIIDLKGSVPTVPGVPQEVVDQGKAPRLTFLSPVTERAKLAAAWSEVNSRATKLMATISEMAGEDIPMQKPMSSEQDGMTTWFIPFPTFSDDFIPSVTVSDKWFAASTSKVQALDLIAKAEAGGEKGDGMKMYVNFDALSNYGDEMLAMVEKNSTALFPEEWQISDFNESKGQIKKFMEAFREFESLSWSTRKEGGQVKTSIHFKTR